MSCVFGPLFSLLYIIVPIIRQHFQCSLNKKTTFFCISRGMVYFNRQIFLRPLYCRLISRTYLVRFEVMYFLYFCRKWIYIVLSVRIS